MFIKRVPNAGCRVQKAVRADPRVCPRRHRGLRLLHSAFCVVRDLFPGCIPQLVYRVKLKLFY